MGPEAARHLPASGINSLVAYWRFYRAVAAAQLGRWLATSFRRGAELLVDMSGPHLPCALQAASAGHAVVRVVPAELPAASGPQETRHAQQRALLSPVPGAAARRAPPDRRPRQGSIATVRADLSALPFLHDHSVDGVIADDRTLSRQLFTEQVIAEAARVLRPGGRLFGCFDSLVLGMAILAEQRHWAQLTDLPSAEVVLVPWPDGTITRCFGAEQLTELFADAQLDIIWIRPRTVLSPTLVEYVLGEDTTVLSHLVRAELAAKPDESTGIHLIVNARKR